jgi:3-hydroxyacyl-[acyl-carrier-protein] dehydratase
MLDVMEIQEILPHRYPFLLVDRITDMEKRNFMGHFPGHPIYPGVLILEGMAQAGGVLALKSNDLSAEELKNKVIYFMSIDKAKFRTPVKPGDKLEYKIEILKLRGTLIVLDGKAYVDDKLVAEAELKAMVVDK